LKASYAHAQKTAFPFRLGPFRDRISVPAFSLLAQSRMWQVEFGIRPVAAGGGEYLTALILGGPSLLLALGLLGTSVAWTAWRSVWSVVGLGIAVVPTLGWLFLTLRDAS